MHTGRSHASRESPPQKEVVKQEQKNPGLKYTDLLLLPDLYNFNPVPRFKHFAQLDPHYFAQLDPFHSQSFVLLLRSSGNFGVMGFRPRRHPLLITCRYFRPYSPCPTLSFRGGRGFLRHRVSQLSRFDLFPLYRQSPLLFIGHTEFCLVSLGDLTEFCC